MSPPYQPDPGKQPGTPSGRLCPKCGTPTVWRLGRYSQFHGCPRYPTCDGKIGAPRGAPAARAAANPDPTPIPEKTPAEHAAAGRAAAETELAALMAKQPQPNPTPENPAAMSSPAAIPSADASNPFVAGMWAMMEPLARQAIAESAQRAATEAVAAARIHGSSVEWKLNGIPFAKIEGTYHQALPEILKRIKAGIKNILLVGPAGSGKTKLAADVAKALNLGFGAVSCTAGMPEWHLTGRSFPDLSTGKAVYQESVLVTSYINGGVFLMDEIDAADPNTLLTLNSALANGHMTIPHRVDGQTIARHDNFVLIAAANTFGQGASRQYVGRSQLDASTLSRFACAVIEVGYDEDLERQLVADKSLIKRVHAIRRKVLDIGMRRVVGTRELLHAYALVTSGESEDFAIKAMTVGWTEDELAKAGAR